MKKIYLLILIVFFAGCTEDFYIDPTVMPEETTIGANTFGCLIDGWIYVGGRYNDYAVFLFDTEIYESINFNYNEEEELMYVAVKVTPESYIYFEIENPVEGKTTRIVNVRWKGEKLVNGTAHITRFDPIEQIISGRFEGGRIQHGQFDVRYGIIAVD